MPLSDYKIKNHFFIECKKGNSDFFYILHNVLWLSLLNPNQVSCIHFVQYCHFLFFQFQADLNDAKNQIEYLSQFKKGYDDMYYGENVFNLLNLRLWLPYLNQLYFE